MFGRWLIQQQQIFKVEMDMNCELEIMKTIRTGCFYTEKS
jgi:hypothetical protein